MASLNRQVTDAEEKLQLAEAVRVAEEQKAANAGDQGERIVVVIARLPERLRAVIKARVAALP